MSNTASVSPSSQLVGVEITTKRTNTDETTNTLNSLYKCDDAEPQTVSEEENSSPSGIEDNDHDNLIIAMSSVENENMNIPDDHTNTAELCFLEGEEEKLMKQDEDLIINEGAESVIQPSQSLSPKTNLHNTPQQEIHQDQLNRTYDPENDLNQEANTIQKPMNNHPNNLDTRTGQILKVDREIDTVKTEIILSNNDDFAPNNSENISSPSKSTKRVKINESSCVVTEHNELSLRRSRMDSIDLDSHAFDFEHMDIGLSNNPGIIGDDSKPSHLPPLANSNENIDSKISPDQIKSNDDTEQAMNLNTNVRGRGYSLDFFSFGMNEDEPLPSVSSVDIGAAQITSNSMSLNQIDPRYIDRDQNLDNNATNDFDLRLRPRGDSIIFDPASFGEGGIHEANALERSRRPSMALEVDEMEIMNAPGLMEPPSEIPDTCESNTELVNLPKVTDNRIHEAPTYPGVVNNQFQQNQVTILSQTKIHSQKGVETINSKSSTFVPTISSNKNITPSNNRHMHSMISMTRCSDMILSPDAMSGSSGVLQIDQMELLNKGGRIGLYLPNARKERIAKFHSKRKMRIWRKRIKYDCRKKLADSRPRIKGRFVKRSDIDDE